jgi:hypothetical protein
VPRDDETILLQCRGPERRLRPIQLVVAAAVIAVLAGALALFGPRDAASPGTTAAPLSEN